MDDRALSGLAIAHLAVQPNKQFADTAAWRAHLEQLGITALKVHPQPAADCYRRRGVGSIHAHDCLRGAVVVSDNAGRFNVGGHALCWMHAERLVGKFDTFTEPQRVAQ